MTELETSTVPNIAWAGAKNPGLSLHRALGSSAGYEERPQVNLVRVCLVRIAVPSES